MRSTPSQPSASLGRGNESLQSSNIRGSANSRTPREASTLHSGSVSRLSRLRSTRSTRMRDDAQRRAHDLRQEMDAAIHVLDNGINRTPMPLQYKHTAAGARGGAGGGGGSQREYAASELGSSVFHSSFLMSGETPSGNKYVNGSAGGGLSSYLQSSSSATRQRKDGKRKASVMSMESSMQSLSMADGSGSRYSPGFRGRGGSSDETMSVSFAGGGGGGGSSGEKNAVVAGVDMTNMTEPENVLDGATFVRHKPLSDAERRAWFRARAGIKLTETPTIFLFDRQDEAVSNENQTLVEDVKEQNELYAELVEAHRIDEGTRFQECGTATFAVAKKSIHCEVHPPQKVNTGGLQVTPWMLKDEFAPLNDADDEDADENEEEKRADDGDADPGNGEDDEADLGDDADETSTQNETMSESGRNESASVNQSGSGGRASSGANQWMFADSFMSNLRVMERAVVQNILEKTQLAYRGITMTADSGRLGVTASTPTPAAKPLEKVAVRTPSVDAAAGDDGVDDQDQSGAIAAPTVVVSSDEVVPFPQSELPPMSTSVDIKTLWRYHSALTRGRAVTSMSWNRKETDLLAVGYGPRRASVLDDDPDWKPAEDADTRGETDNKVNGTSGREKDSASERGMICCWSLKNPLAPELVLHLQADAAVSALAFSFEHPSLLAVGDTAGGIVVYDVQKDLASPSIVPAVTTGLHTGAVWALKWVTNGKERGEFLMSISADGRVVQWVVGKTVEKVAPDLMHLKRQPGAQVESAFVEGVAAAEAAANAAAAAGRRGKKTAGAAGANGNGAAAAASKEDAVLSGQAGGMCFDVCPADHAIYVVGTEDGSVYQCNKSQTETYDLDYAAHAELVYHIRWSPFSAKYFLTCSADWTTRLYALGHAPTLLQFDSPNQDAVQDVAWSYANALYFATVTAQGNVELWSVRDPIYPRATVHFDDHRRLNCVLFAEQETPVIVVGDDEGDVTVFLLKESIYGRQDLTDDEQELWLEEAVKKGV